MRVLFLGPSASPLIPYLSEADEVATITAPLTIEFIDSLGPDWTVSYGYRYVLPAEVLRRLDGRAVNLHVSLLPWNRGADPNLWSFVENTPKGVSIHFIDSGLDTGDLIAQRTVALSANATLRSSYTALQNEVQCLFREFWPAIKVGAAPRRRQPSGGSYHCLADRARILHLLTDGWETPVSAVRQLAAGA
jgi:methionyl-tRNA formyltransferase